MPTVGHAARVGAVVLVAVALFIWMWSFFVGNTLDSKTYDLDVLFDDASGIDKDAPVDLAGVQIGTVQSVFLKDQKANLRLKIKKDQPIPQGSRFTISTPGLATSGVVSIVPPPDAATRPPIAPETPGLRGERPGDLSSAMLHATALMDQVAETTRKANKLLEAATELVGSRKLRTDLEETADNLNTASANGVKLTDRLNTVLDTDNARLVALLNETQGRSKVALDNLVDTTAQVRGVMRDNRQQITEIVGNLRDSSAAIAGIASQTNDMLKGGAVTKNVAASVANLKTLTDKLNTIAGNMEKLTGDKGVQEDVRATLHNVRQTSEETAALTERLNHIIGGRKKTVAVVAGPGGAAAVAVPPSPTSAKTGVKTAAPLLRADLVQNTRDSHFRMDVDATMPLSTAPLTFGLAGIYGVGDNNRITLQYGQALPGGVFDYRGGLYASKLALGADFGLGRDTIGSLDLYDPNRLHLDARGVMMLSKELGLTFGGEDILRHSGTVVGVEFRR
jgi:phospholipid/cholesterol/gamma-HCH transport system substrate-binding protein